MSLKRIGLVLLKDLLYGSRSFLVIFVILIPLFMWLIVTLIFGGTPVPRLGIADEGSSQLKVIAQQLPSIEVKEYSSAEELTRAVEAGAVDSGIVLPGGFDDSLALGNAGLILYTWGQSLASNRTIVRSTIATILRQIAGQQPPVQIDIITIGEGENIPWSQRILPLIVVMPIVMGGIYLTATSVVQEKEKKTLNALVVTPASLGEIYMAKALLGFIFSLFIGIAILLLNRALGNEPWLMVLLMSLGTVMAVELGLIFSSFVNNVNTLFATARISQLLIMAPTFFYLFPSLPQWIARIFPSYYFIAPIMKISQAGAHWSDVSTDVFILIGCLILMGAIAWLMIRKIRQYAA